MVTIKTEIRVNPNKIDPDNKKKRIVKDERRGLLVLYLCDLPKNPNLFAGIVIEGYLVEPGHVKLNCMKIDYTEHREIKSVDMKFNFDI